MQVSILSTSDVHGYVLPDDFRYPYAEKNFGLAKSATALKEQSDGDVTIMIENGDFIQGSPLTDYAKQKDTLTTFNTLAEAIGYDVQILGNHEFNYGRTFLEEFYQNNDRLLNANVVDTETMTPFIGQPYRIIEQSGVIVAVIGVTTQYVPNWETETHIQNLRFLNPVTTVEHYVDELRNMVDIVVVAYHGGIERDLETGEPTENLSGENQGYELSLIPGVDAVVTGHQHRQIASHIAGTPVTQPGYRGEAIGKITLELDDANQVINTDAKLINVERMDVNNVVQKLIEPVQVVTDKWLDTPIVTMPYDMKITNHFEARMSGHPYIELVNAVQMDVSDTKIASTALFNDEVQGLGKLVTRRDIMTNYIYPNEVVVQRLTGQDIKDALEVNAGYFQIDGETVVVNPKYLWPKVEHYNYDLWSGINYTFDLTQPVGQRVKDLTQADQTPLQMTEFYDVAMNQYRATGAGGFNMFSPNKTIREIPGSMTDHLIHYLSERGASLNNQPTHFKVIKD